MLSSIMSKSSSFIISYASSIHSQHKTPISTDIDVTFNGSSNPLKYIFCPVGLYVISNGLSFVSQNSSTCNLCIAHFNSVKQLSFNVLNVFLITNVFASGYFIMLLIIHRAVVFDFLLPLDPLTTLYLHLQCQNSAYPFPTILCNDSLLTCLWVLMLLILFCNIIFYHHWYISI